LILFIYLCVIAWLACVGLFGLLVLRGRTRRPVVRLGAALTSVITLAAAGTLLALLIMLLWAFRDDPWNEHTPSKAKSDPALATVENLVLTDLGKKWVSCAGRTPQVSFCTVQGHHNGDRFAMCVEYVLDIKYLPLRRCGITHGTMSRDGYELFLLDS
jgi:hypothetical protein